MYKSTRILIPIMDVCMRQAATQSSRQFFQGGRGPWAMRDFFGNMERTMDNLERHFLRNTPLGIMTPRFMPIEGAESNMDTNYRINIDVQHFKPEDIKISLKNGVLKIQAHMDKEAEDGSRFKQSIVREYKLPENVDSSAVKSLLHDNGILTIEAPINKSKEPKNIPIEHTGEDKTLNK